MNASITHSESTITAFPQWQGESIPEYPIDIFFKIGVTRNIYAPQPIIQYSSHNELITTFSH